MRCKVKFWQILAQYWLRFLELFGTMPDHFLKLVLIILGFVLVRSSDNNDNNNNNNSNYPHHHHNTFWTYSSENRLVDHAPHPLQWQYPGPPTRLGRMGDVFLYTYNNITKYKTSTRWRCTEAPCIHHAQGDRLIHSMHYPVSHKTCVGRSKLLSVASFTALSYDPCHASLIFV